MTTATRPVHGAFSVRGWRGRLLFGAATVACGCSPRTLRIDGMPAVSPNPAEPWMVPRAAVTPPLTLGSPELTLAATAALRADSATAGRVQELSMAQVVDLALRNNPVTRESWAAARSAADRYGASLGALLPNINGSVNVSETNTGGSGGSGGGGADSLQSGGGNGAGASTRGGSSSLGTRTALAPSLSLSYLLLDFGGRGGTIESAKQEAISADLSHNATIQNVVLEAESSVFSMLAVRGLRDAQLLAVTEAEADTAAAEARLRVGLGTLEEVLQTRTALGQAHFQLATFQGNLLTARANLAAAMGLPANAPFDVPTVVAADSVAAIGASVDTLINRAIVLRPELAQARAEAQSLAAQIRVARSEGYPALTLSSNANYLGTLQNGASGTHTVSLALGLQIPIFNGFARQYNVRVAQDDYQAGLARVASAAQQITVQVFAAYAALQTAAQRVLAAQELLTSSQQSADVAAGRYREGVGTIVDVILARSALATARADEIQSRWEWRTALAQLAHDVGSLDREGRPNLMLIPPGPR